MIDNIILAFIVVTVIALVSSIVLALASYFLSVKEDERVLKIREQLPGVNCGACGYAGCDEYAKALVNSNAKTNLCIPGADATAINISKILGVEFEDVVEMSANVRCNGNCNVTDKETFYNGIKTCAAASMIYGGPNSCKYGCLGFGDCLKVCPANAICIKNGIAIINQSLCIGCGLCASTCPKSIIELVPQTSKVFLQCNNKEKGGVARKKCSNACIGCKKCELSCPEKAITVTDNLAHIDYDKCSGCGLCAENCPTGCIKSLVNV